MHSKHHNKSKERAKGRVLRRAHERGVMEVCGERQKRVHACILLMSKSRLSARADLSVRRRLVSIDPSCSSCTCELSCSRKDGRKCLGELTYRYGLLF